MRKTLKLKNLTKFLDGDNNTFSEKFAMEIITKNDFLLKN